MDALSAFPSPEWMGPELRDHKRIDVNIPVTLLKYRGTETDTTDELIGRLLDLSTGGMMIQINARFSPGEKFLASFDISSQFDEGRKRAFNIVSIVRQHFEGLQGETMYGLEFKEFHQGKPEEIKSLVDSVT